MAQKEYITNQHIEVNRGTLSTVQRWGWTLFSVFVIAVLVEPAYIADQGGILHRFFYVSKYIATAFVLFTYFIQRLKLNGFILGCVIFEAILFLSTIVNSASIMDWVKDGAYVITFALFLHMLMNIDSELLLRSLDMVLGAYTNINTLSKLVYPAGMFRQFNTGNWNCWFLGYDNVACVIIVVAISISLFRIFLYRGRWMIWDWSVIIGGVWFTFSLNIATAIVAMNVSFLFMILTRHEWIREKIGKAWLIIVCMIGLFLFIQFFFTQKADSFSFIFQILQKSSTFSGRAQLWQKAWFDLEQEKIILGFGVHGSNEYVLHFGQNWNFHLHCYYLQVIYEGGLVAFGALLGWLLHAARRFDQIGHRNCTMAFLAGLLAIMFMWQMEASNNLVRYFVIVLFLLYNAKEFESLGQKYQYRRWRLVFHAPGRCMGQKKIGGNIA